MNFSWRILLLGAVILLRCDFGADPDSDEGSEARFLGRWYLAKTVAVDSVHYYTEPCEGEKVLDSAKQRMVEVVTDTPTSIRIFLNDTFFVDSQFELFAALDTTFYSCASDSLMVWNWSNGQIDSGSMEAYSYTIANDTLRLESSGGMPIPPYPCRGCPCFDSTVQYLQRLQLFVRAVP